jgi:hypothetical protein
VPPSWLSYCYAGRLTGEVIVVARVLVMDVMDVVIVPIVKAPETASIRHTRDWPVVDTSWAFVTC